MLDEWNRMQPCRFIMFQRCHSGQILYSDCCSSKALLFIQIDVMYQQNATTKLLRNLNVCFALGALFAL